MPKAGAETPQRATAVPQRRGAAPLAATGTTPGLARIGEDGPWRLPADMIVLTPCRAASSIASISGAHASSVWGTRLAEDRYSRPPSQRDCHGVRETGGECCVGILPPSKYASTAAMASSLQSWHRPRDGPLRPTSIDARKVACVTAASPGEHAAKPTEAMSAVLRHSC